MNNRLKTVIKRSVVHTAGKPVWRRIPRAILAVVILPAILSIFPIQTDPGDNFGFGLHHPPAVGSEFVMSVQQIEDILKARLLSVPSDQIPKLAKHLSKLAQFYRFDPAFVLSMIQAESGFRVTAVSYAGAVGLMQLMPATASVVIRDMRLPLPPEAMAVLRLGRVVENGAHVVSRQLLMDPFVNLTLGVAYLGFLRDRYQDVHPYYLVAAYNVGPARMDELMSKKGFRPDKTKKYFEAIRQGVSQFRHFGQLEVDRPKKQAVRTVQRGRNA